MGTIIERLDGSRYELDDLAIHSLDFIVSSPEYRIETEEVEGADGLIVLGTTVAPRNILLSLYFEADDDMQYAYKRDEVYSLFESTEPFYVIEKRKPGQRWLVRIEQPYSPEQIRKY